MSRLLCATVLAMFALTVGSTPAYAADELEVSEDGIVWRDSIDDPLFDTPVHWVPGDDETRQFWIRNNSSSEGSWRMGVDGLDSGLFQSGDVDIRVKAGGSAWNSLESTGSPMSGKLPAGEVMRFDVNVKFDEASTNPSQNEVLPLAFNFEVSEAIGSAGETNQDDVSGLNRTGAELVPNLILAGTVASLAGALLIVAIRRRREPQRSER